MTEIFSFMNDDSLTVQTWCGIECEKGASLARALTASGRRRADDLRHEGDADSKKVTRGDGRPSYAASRSRASFSPTDETAAAGVTGARRMLTGRIRATADSSTGGATAGSIGPARIERGFLPVVQPSKPL